MKTVLFLINGFGIESKDSYSIYDKDLMPNLDNLIKTSMFEKLDNNVTNIAEAYRNNSLGISELYNYSIVGDALSSKENTLLNSPVIQGLNTRLTKDNKLHMFCFVDKTLKIVEHLKVVLKNFNKDGTKKIFLHIILTSNNIEDYKNIQNVLSKMNVELSEYAKIGMVFGLKNVTNNIKEVDMNFFTKTLVTEVGERWQSFKQKIEVCYGIKQAPVLVKPFVVNTGFALKENDLVLFWNYDRIDLDNFVNNISNRVNGKLILSSLFEVKSSKNMPYVLTSTVSKKSLAKSLETYDKKTLVLCGQKDIGTINYYLNGLQSINNPRISFIPFEKYMYKPSDLWNIINTYQQDLIILNYSIDDCVNIDDLKSRLHNIDIMVGYLYENYKMNPYTLAITSLYGLNKVLSNGNDVCNINYSSKVPFVFIDNIVNRKTYMINLGTSNDIFRTMMHHLDKKAPNGLIEKKNFIYSLFFK